jgi:hypothetical protein
MVEKIELTTEQVKQRIKLAIIPSKEKFLE